MRSAVHVTRHKGPRQKLTLVLRHCPLLQCVLGSFFHLLLEGTSAPAECEDASHALTQLAK